MTEANEAKPAPENVGDFSEVGKAAMQLIDHLETEKPDAELVGVLMLAVVKDEAGSLSCLWSSRPGGEAEKEMAEWLYAGVREKHGASSASEAQGLR